MRDYSIHSAISLIAFSVGMILGAGIALEEGLPKFVLPILGGITGVLIQTAHKKVTNKYH